MLKYIPESWRDDMRTNFAHKHNFYFNPRNRVIPNYSLGTVTYIKNDRSTNMRGTYRAQFGAASALTYLYQLPQRFIIEGWFKPEWAYDVAGIQPIFGDPSPYEMLLAYDATSDFIYFYTSPGSNHTSGVFTSNAQLQKWIYVRCFYDNLAKLKGFYCTVNGVVVSDSQSVPGAGSFDPLNTIRFFPAVTAESSYWIIHELDETLATGAYKTYQADRQIIFEFNGISLARERIRIPLVHDSDDTRGVKSFNVSRSVENQMSGSPGANTASMTLLNVNGSFSDDQYDAFDPFNGYYNGTEKYLQNRVQVEIDSESPANTVRDGLIAHYSFDDELATDNSGHGYTGTITGATTTTGKSGKALAFDSDGDEVDLGSVTDLAFTSAMTISAWIYCADYSDGLNKTIIGKGTAFSDLQDYSIAVYNNGNCYFMINITGVRSTVVGSLTAYDGQWVHVAGVYDGADQTIYVNGANIAHAHPTGNILTAYAQVKIGDCTGATDQHFVGNIDEVRFYNRALTTAEVLYLAQHPADWGAISKVEPLIIGRTTPGAFKRSSPSIFYGDVKVDIEDTVAEIGETKVDKAYAFATHDLCDATTESDSLVHDIARIVTRKPIRNYAFNSSFENATIGNSWVNVGMATCDRYGTAGYFLLGSYGMRCIADTIGDYVWQRITFDGTDKIDVGDVFNLSVYLRQDTAAAVRVSLTEQNSVPADLGYSYVDSGADINVFTRIDVTRTIAYATCTRLSISIYALKTCTFYVDAVMLTRTLDPFDCHIINTTDAASGEGSADDAAIDYYDTCGFDCESVDVEHPYFIVPKGGSPWEALKDISQASIGSYLGMSPDNCLVSRVRYNEENEDNLGDVEDVASISVSIDDTRYNSIKVVGNQIVTEDAVSPIYSGHDSGQFEMVNKKMFHPIADGAFAEISSASDIELVYSEEE